MEILGVRVGDLRSSDTRKERPRDLDLDDNRQSPDGYYGNEVLAYGHDVADSCLLKDDTEANEVTESMVVSSTQ